jgi:hypothetical protein
MVRPTPATSPTDVPELPPPPRAIRRFAGTTVAWPYFVFGIASALCLALILTILSVAGMDLSPFARSALDTHGVATVRGEVTARRSTGINTPDGQLVRIAYAFRPVRGERTEPVHGAVVLEPLDARGLNEGSSVLVRYVEATPSINELEGFEAARLSTMMNILIGVLMVGTAGLLVWWRAVTIRRLLLRDGLQTSGRVVKWTPLSWINPPQIHLHVEYLDAQGAGRPTYGGRLFLPASHALAKRAAELAGPREAIEAGAQFFVPLLHDERDPQRIALAEEAALA